MKHYAIIKDDKIVELVYSDSRPFLPVFSTLDKKYEVIEITENTFNELAYNQ